MFVFHCKLFHVSSHSLHAKWKVKSTLGFVESLPERHQELLGDYKDHIRSLHTCINVNQGLFNRILGCVGNVYEIHSKIYDPITVSLRFL